MTYSYRGGLVTIKKMLIYLLMILDNLRLFVKVKTDDRMRHWPRIDPLVSIANERIIRSKIGDKKRYKQTRFKLDLKLLQKPVEQLIRMVSIADVLFFLKVSQINFLVKNPGQKKVKNGCRSRLISLKLKPAAAPNQKACAPKQELLSRGNDIPNGAVEPRQTGERQGRGDGPESAQWVEFEVLEYEIDEIILAKRKRPDEELKHSFKAVRKGIEKYFREGVQKTSGDKASNPKTRTRFNKEILGNNRRYTEQFKQSNITKEVVADLKKCVPFVRLMEEYIDEHFLEDEIESNVLNKKEEIMNDKLSLKDFLLALMTKQKKNGWIVQNILNSLDVLENCREETILKRKTRHKGRDRLPVSAHSARDQNSLTTKNRHQKEWMSDEEKGDFSARAENC